MKNRALQRINVPGLPEQVATFLGGEFERRWRIGFGPVFGIGVLIGSDCLAGSLDPPVFGFPTTGSLPRTASHLVGVRSVVTDHLHPLVTDVRERIAWKSTGSKSSKLRLILGSSFER